MHLLIFALDFKLQQKFVMFVIYQNNTFPLTVLNNRIYEKLLVKT